MIPLPTSCQRKTSKISQEMNFVDIPSEICECGCAIEGASYSLGARDVFCSLEGPKGLSIKIDLLNDGE